MSNVNNVRIADAIIPSNSSSITTSEANARLQQAAHILVNGAIRAAAKHRSAQAHHGAKHREKQASSH